MSEVNFFVPKGPFYLNELSDELSNIKNKTKISNVKTLNEAKKNDITFFNSIDYIHYAKKTKA